MSSHKISESFNELTDSAREYVQLKIDHFKLTLVEKASGLVTFLVIASLTFILFLFFTLFLSLAFIYFFRENWGPEWAGALIITGFYLLLGISLFLFRKKLFTDRIVAKLSKIILEENHEE